MADSTTNLETISASQAAKEVTANTLIDAGSPAMYGGRHAEACSGLTWGYYGGRWGGSAVANGTIGLGASTTTYIVANRTTGAITASTTTTNWSDTSTYARLYKVVTGASGVTSYEDHRTGPGGVVAAGGSSGAQPFDVTAFYPGVPTASAKVLRVPIARAVTFPANFSGAYGKASAAATGSTAFDIQKNGSSVGTMTFAASASSATFTSAGGAAVAFAAGDILAVVAPGTPDATLADIGIVLAGTR